MSNKIGISVLVLAIGITVLIAVTAKVIFSQDLSGKDIQSVSAVNNQMTMMPGGDGMMTMTPHSDKPDDE